MKREHIVIRVERVLSSLISDAGIDHAAITQGARFSELGMDDLDLYNAICSAEEIFGVTLQDQMLTSDSKVFDLIEVIERARSEKSRIVLAQDLRKTWEDFPPIRAIGSK